MSNEKNEAFAKLTAKEQRVAIAKDVLVHIATRKIVAKQGTYFEIKHRSFSADMQACEVVAAAPSCTVCALGAVFVAAIDNANEATMDDMDPDDFGNRIEIGHAPLKRYLSRFFSVDQLHLIEAAFESSDIHDFFEYDAVQPATNMFNDFVSSEERMQIIMRNIIDNDGTFIPSANP